MTVSGPNAMSNRAIAAALLFLAAAVLGLSALYVAQVPTPFTSLPVPTATPTPTMTSTWYLSPDRFVTVGGSGAL